MNHAVCLTVLLNACLAPAFSQWDLETSNTTADLRGIHSIGNGIAWASGTNGTVLRTEDGGYAWQTCTVPLGAEKLDFRGIQAFDANTAIVMSSGKGDLSRLYKTTDGCHSWKQVLSNDEAEGFWDVISFQHGDFGFAIGHSQTGVLIGDPVRGHFQTYAMILGHGWFVDDAGCNAPDGQAAFAASNASIIVFGSRRYILGSGGKPGASVFISPLLVGGTASGPCRRISVPMAGGTDSSGIFALGFRDLKQGIAVGGDFTKPNDISGNAAWTRDMGLHWNTPTALPHGYRSSVAYDAATKVWITVGPNGTDISTDDGKNWRALRPDPARHDPPDADRNWNALSLPFVVGPHGRIGKLNPAALHP